MMQTMVAFRRFREIPLVAGVPDGTGVRHQGSGTPPDLSKLLLAGERLPHPEQHPRRKKECHVLNQSQNE